MYRPALPSHLRPSVAVRSRVRRVRLARLAGLACGALLAGIIPGCAVDDAPATTTTPQELSLGFHRERVAGDVYHYSFELPVGTSPNARLAIHRVVREIAPFVPRPTAHAALLLHGDFATFTTSFVPGMAGYLAAHDIDVWGVDRRWTLATDDISDFGAMGAEQEVADVARALDVARTLRRLGNARTLRGRGDAGAGDKLVLVGFSHGAELAYDYAASDGRGIDGLVALDFFGAFAPADAELRAATCGTADAEYQDVADGVVDAPNDFFIAAGQLDASAPDEASPLIDGRTNREVVLLLLGQTYTFAPFTPTYRLLEPTADGTAFAHVAEPVADAWLADAPPHESMLEAADLDALLCHDMPLARIRVPLLYVGASDGIGAYGVYATTQVSSTDVTSFVVPGYGHGDLLFADDAVERVWQPLAAWLARH